MCVFGVGVWCVWVVSVSVCGVCVWYVCECVCVCGVVCVFVCMYVYTLSR